MSLDKRLHYYVAFLAIPSVARAALPLELQTVVPQCALNCVEEFVHEEYSESCAEPLTLDCLCTRYGKSGYALDQGRSTDLR